MVVCYSGLGYLNLGFLGKLYYYLAVEQFKQFLLISVELSTENLSFSVI